MTGGALAIVGVLAAIMSAIFISKIVARFGEATTALAGSPSASLARLDLVWFCEQHLVVHRRVPIGRALGHHQRSTAVADDAPRRCSEQGQLQGAISSMFGMAGMIGPLLFTGIFSAAVSRGVLPGTPFWFGALLLAAGFVVTRTARGNSLSSHVRFLIPRLTYLDCEAG